VERKVFGHRGEKKALLSSGHGERGGTVILGGKKGFFRGEKVPTRSGMGDNIKRFCPFEGGGGRGARGKGPRYQSEGKEGGLHAPIARKGKDVDLCRWKRRKDCPFNMGP